MHPVFVALTISVLLNLFVFIFAFRKQTDHFTDITYSATFILLAVWSFLQGDTSSLPRQILLAMILLWAFRLGGYLFTRIGRIGVDHRFDEMRPVWQRYIKFWILQGLSVWLVALPYVIALNSESAGAELLPVHLMGLAIWLIGLLLESIADAQKSRFRNNPKNEGKFMQSGLFSVLQYPNYLGEMLVWVGVFVYCIPFLQNLEWLSAISPIWIIVLLLFISGIPFLKRSSAKRYGHLESYQDYQKKTSKLIPFIY